MISRFRLIVSVLIISFSPFSVADSIYTDNRSRQALKQPVSGLTAAELNTFSAGRSLFDQMWVIAPSQDKDIDGLGPLFNSISCLQCHPGNGRGHAPDNPDQKMRSMLIRLSQVDEQGNIITPHPLYGDQLQDQAIPGVPAEGRASIDYREFTITLADGTPVPMREPTVTLSEAAYGDFSDALTSARIGPALVGMGLIEAIAEQDIVAYADSVIQQQQGISGRVHRLQHKGKQQVGRFGYKASVPTLTAQTVSAFHGDLGITSRLHPEQNCTAVQTACQQAVTGGEPELSDKQLDEVSAYLHWLAVPKPQSIADEQLQRGQQLFRQANCVACHRPSYITDISAQPKQLANQTIWPYSDFLLHDMGEQLADHRPDGDATGHEWRTAPLWGIGLSKTINARANYLHDGRARTVLEAILWHGGEAQASQNFVKQLPEADRDALLAFINSR